MLLIVEFVGFVRIPTDLTSLLAVDSETKCAQHCDIDYNCTGFSFNPSLEKSCQLDFGKDCLFMPVPDVSYHSFFECSESSLFLYIPGASCISSRRGPRTSPKFAGINKLFTQNSNTIYFPGLKIIQSCTTWERYGSVPYRILPARTVSAMGPRPVPECCVGGGRRVLGVPHPPTHLKIYWGRMFG